MTDNVRQGERIAKVMARAGLCSRREAEAWIAAGRVAIDGKPIASPAVNVTAKDRITVDGAPLPRAERTRLFLFHKPRGLMTTNADQEGRPTIFAALPKHLPRLVSVGRLDLNTEGLLLLTNDGGLARVLELPETGWLRRYRVRAHGRVTQDQLDALRNGVTIDGIRYGAIEAALDRDQGTNVWLTFAIREGKNREVRTVLEHLGLKVARLIRVSFGPFQLGELPSGATEEVKTRHLREQLGNRIAEQAGCDFAAPVAAPIPPLKGEEPAADLIRGGFARRAKPGEEGSPTRPPPNSGLPEFGSLNRASRKHATCVAATPRAKPEGRPPRKRGKDKDAQHVPEGRAPRKRARDEAADRGKSSPFQARRDGERRREGKPAARQRFKSESNQRGEKTAKDNRRKGAAHASAKPHRVRRRYHGKRER